MRETQAPIFIVGNHRTGSTVWHNIIAMAPGICRITEMRFLAPWWQRDFRYFLKSQIGDLSRDVNVDKLVALMFSRKPLPGLESAFWRFEYFDFVSGRECAPRSRDPIEALGRYSGHCSSRCALRRAETAPVSSSLWMRATSSTCCGGIPTAGSCILLETRERWRCPGRTTPGARHSSSRDIRGYGG
jgi:hypothetical protein